MAADVGSKVFEKLDLSNDEVTNLKKAFENPEFRQLFKEYAEEISDPENRKRYEEEIAAMEQDRGMNVQFINPKPGHVLKTSENGTTKVFINICHNELIGKPSVSKELQNGVSGARWSLPHSFSPPRDDLDKKKELCKVYDVVFHPDTYHMASKNIKFREMIEGTALDGIESQFGVKLDKKNIKKVKIDFKGTPTATVIRTKRPDFEEKQMTKEKNATSEEANNPLDQFPYPYNSEMDSNELAAKNAESLKDTKSKSDSSKNGVASQDENGFTAPKYSIKYSHDFDLQQCRDAPDAGPSTRPSKLIVSIDLPLIRSAASCDLDITERRLKLRVEKPASYLLDIHLPYPVDEANGKAQFDKSARQLKVTLPVCADTEKSPFAPVPVPAEVNGKDEATSDHLSCNGTSNPLIQVLESKPTESNPLNSTASATALCDTRDVLDEDDDDDGTQGESRLPSSLCSSKIESWTFDNTSNLTDMCKTTSGVRVPTSFEFLQDSTWITLILCVKNVELKSICLRTDPSMPEIMGISFTSCGHGGWPIHYTFFLGCLRELSCNLVDAASAKQHINVSATCDNVTVNLKKVKRNVWSQIKYGGSADIKEIYDFPSNRLSFTLPDALKPTTQPRTSKGDTLPDALKPTTQPRTSKGDNSNKTTQSEDLGVQVIDLCQEKIDIRIVPLSQANTQNTSPNTPGATGLEDSSPPTTGPEEPSDTAPSCPISKRQKAISESEMAPLIIHNDKNGRPTKGILKQTSESSEDGGVTPSDLGVSPIDFPSSHDEYNSPASSNSSGPLSATFRKSVSFSQRTDRAVFTPADPVSSLHQTLRNRRKRAKKRERHGQQRHNSEGNGSSGCEGTPDDQVPPVEQIVAEGIVGDRRRNLSESDVVFLPQAADNSEPEPIWTPAKSSSNHHSHKGRGNKGRRNHGGDSHHSNPSTTNSPSSKKQTEPAASKKPTEKPGPPSAPTDNGEGVPETDSAYVSWQDMPGVKKMAENANPHRTVSCVPLTSNLTFELDDD